MLINAIRTSGQLGPCLRSLRRARGWSQAELGEKIGMSQTRIAKIENAPEKVAFNTLLTILMALDAEFQVAAHATQDGIPSEVPPTSDAERW